MVTFTSHKIDGNVPKDSINDGPKYTQSSRNSEDGDIIVDVAIVGLVVGHGYPGNETKCQETANAQSDSE